jgi:hypothetical protein
LLARHEGLRAEMESPAGQCLAMLGGVGSGVSLSVLDHPAEWYLVATC